MTLGERLSRVHALVAGDLMLDEHVWGNVHRISPEAPVPVVEVLGREHVPGGAANTAAGVVALGGQASLGGVVGTDGAAEVLCDALTEAGVDVDGVLRADGRSTTTKTRIIAHGQQIVRIDEEVRTEVPAAVAERLLDWAQELLGEIDVMIVSDYRKGVLVPSVAQGLIRLASQAGVPSVVDIKGNNLPKYRGATLLTPNLSEARRAANIDEDADVGLEEIADRLGQVVPGSAVLITRGSEGMTLFGPDGTLDVEAEVHEVYDVTGAGDTVVAALATAIGRGLGLEESVRIANTAAGIAVSKVGTATVSLDELSEKLRQASWPANEKRLTVHQGR